MSFFASVISDAQKWLSSLTIAQLPSREVIGQIRELRLLMNTPYMHDTHEHMLVSLFENIKLHTNHEYLGVAFCRSSISWKKVGFQHEDPESDFRGGGALALQNLNYFLIHFGKEAAEMIRRREERENGANYPWAAAGINITRLVAKCFELVSANGYTSVTTHTTKAYWNILVSDTDAFNRLYVVAVRLLDAEFTAVGGSYLTFPIILQVRLV